MESLEKIIEKWTKRDREVSEFSRRHWAELYENPEELAKAEQEITYWNQRLLRGGVKTDSDLGLENALRLFHGQYHRTNIKMGIDPTIDVLHLGHTVGLHKVRLFQQLGCNTVIIIGDWTARIGDPSGSGERPNIGLEEARRNAQSILSLLFKILDKDKTTIKYNSKWHGESGFTKGELEEILMKINASPILSMKRFKEGKGRSSLLQFFYAAYQAIDSLVLGTDIEAGGTDQEINFQVARDLQRAFGIDPQIGYMTPLLTGTDGKKKMSKSEGNYIALNTSPHDMYGKVMSISDKLLEEWWNLLTVVGYDPEKTLPEWCSTLKSLGLKKKDEHMELKRALAFRVVSRYHSKEEAFKELREFERVFQMRELPTRIPSYNLSDAEVYPSVESAIKNNAIPVYEILYITGMAPSKGQARRLIEQEGVRIGRQMNTHYDARTVKSIDEMILLSELNETIINIGPRRYGRILFDYKTGPVTTVVTNITRTPEPQSTS